MLTVIAALIGGILYRLRGGWFSNISRAIGWEWGGKQRTQTMRLIWSIPTACLFAWTLGLSWPIALALVVSTFAGLALFGHGAHMVFDTTYYLEKASVKGRTEILTGFWLPALFGGIPDATWPHGRVVAYNLIGMSAISLVRNAVTAAPLNFAGEPIAAAIYAASGLLHGPLYWIGYRINGKGETSEVVVGAASYALIVNL